MAHGLKLKLMSSDKSVALIRGHRSGLRQLQQPVTGGLMARCHHRHRPSVSGNLDKTSKIVLCFFGGVRTPSVTGQ
jgi:hypothetical protein